ncbi:MAG: sugar phosphate isomerase/epimerase [Lachnospiraceae bacterium]|nr:sugar phosphate isomerase/epimerase [Lachnospiraceae bacterium]
MKTGIQTAHYEIHGTDIVDYKKMKEHGFDCADFSGLTDIRKDLFHMDVDSFTQKMLAEKGRADEAGIEIFQVHAPWPVDDTSEEKRNANLAYMKRAVLGTSLLGCSYIVVHPVMPFGWGAEPDPAFARRVNKEYFAELCDYARPLGVTICMENMPFVDCQLSFVTNLVPFVEEMNLDNLKICLDTGHAHTCIENAGDMARLCGSNLKTLHLHDNAGRRGGHGDEHACPYTCTIDWVNFKNALKEIGYQGCLSLECHSVNEDCPADIREDMLKLLCRIARSLG